MRCLVCGTTTSSDSYCHRCANLVRNFESLVKDNICAAKYFLYHQGTRLEMWERVLKKAVNR